LPTKYLLDTHIWVWLQEGDASRLKPRSVAFLSQLQRESRLFVSLISVWEIAQLLAKERLVINAPLNQWLQQSWADDALQPWPLTEKILIESTQLPDEAHGDPADRMIMATARIDGFTILTQDKRILAYPSVSAQRI
jgi:PIN domain nuclease of toxin-antitoxin system